MLAIFDMFEERVQEINTYFYAVKAFDQGPTAQIPDALLFDSEFIMMLKTSILLIIWSNLPYP